jgi:hypothetical protein
VMTIEKHGTWLHVWADFPACAGIPAWYEVLACKVPLSECEYLPETDIWKVRRRHRQLLVTLEAIYLALTDPDPAMLKQVPQMLECIEKWCPAVDQMQRELQDMLGFRSDEASRNWGRTSMGRDRLRLT